MEQNELTQKNQSIPAPVLRCLVTIIRYSFSPSSLVQSSSFVFIRLILHHHFPEIGRSGSIPICFCAVVRSDTHSQMTPGSKDDSRYFILYGCIGIKFFSLFQKQHSWHSYSWRYLLGQH